MRKVCFNVVYNFGGLSEEEFKKIFWDGERPIFSPDMGGCLAYLTCNIENTHTGEFVSIGEMTIDGRGTKVEWVHEFYSGVNFFDSDGTAHARGIHGHDDCGYSEYMEERNDGDDDDGECAHWCDEKKFFPSFAECVQDAFDIGLGWLLKNEEEGGNG